MYIILCEGTNKYVLKYFLKLPMNAFVYQKQMNFLQTDGIW